MKSINGILLEGSEKVIEDLDSLKRKVAAREEEERQRQEQQAKELEQEAREAQRIQQQVATAQGIGNLGIMGMQVAQGVGQIGSSIATKAAQLKDAVATSGGLTGVAAGAGTKLAQVGKTLSSAGSTAMKFVSKNPLLAAGGVAAAGLAALALRRRKKKAEEMGR